MEDRAAAAGDDSLKGADHWGLGRPLPARRGGREAVLVGTLVLVAYLALRISPVLTLGALSDDGIYVALGKALAEGEGYRSVYAAGDPVHAKYPPGLPAVHAILWSLADSLTVVHRWALLLSAVVTAVAAGVLWWVGRVRLGAPALGVAVLGVGPLLLESSVQYLNLAISEPWFVLGWVGAVALFRWGLARGGGPALAVGVVVGGTALFRTQATVSVPAFLLAGWLATEGRSPSSRLRTLGALALGALTPILAWRLWHAGRMARGPLGTQPDEAAYTTWLPEADWGERVAFVWDVVVYNLEAYGTFVPDQFFRPAWVGAAILAALLGAAIVGGLRLLKAAPELGLPLAAQAAMVLVWPFAQDRFLVPLLPFFGLAALAAVLPRRVAPPPALSVSVGHGLMHRSRVLAAAGLVAVAALVAARQADIRAGTFVPGDDAVLYHPSRFLVANSVALLTAGQWIERNGAPDDVVLAPFAPSLFLYTGRKTVNAEPAQPDLGPNVFDVPGRFLARRSIEDGATLLILMGPGFDIVRDVAEVQARCPDALEYLGSVERPAQISGYRIRVDPCLRALAGY